MSIPWLLMPWLLASPGHQQTLQDRWGLVFHKDHFETLTPISVAINDQNMQIHFDGLVQERWYSIANALELHLSCINSSVLSFLKWLQHEKGQVPCVSLAWIFAAPSYLLILHWWLLTVQAGIITLQIINPCHAGSVWESMKTYLRFSCLFNNEMAQVVEIFLHGRQVSIYSA